MTTPSPPSWLQLERYALDELDTTARARIEDTLRSDEASRVCLVAIDTDRRELPPLVFDKTPLERDSARVARRSGWWRGFIVAAPALVAVALVLFMLWPRGGERERWIAPLSRRPIPSQIAIKGGDLAIALLRDRGGVAQRDPFSFREGDRFKVLVTSPPRRGGAAASGKTAGCAAEVVVFQGGEAYLPLPRVPCLLGGNAVPLGGAFVLDGAAPVDICLITPRAGALPTRDRLAQLHVPDDLRALSVLIVCQGLLHEGRVRRTSPHAQDRPFER